MSGFWMMGMRSWDYATWADDGMSGVYSEREKESGLKAFSGDALAEELAGMETEALGWALGLSEDVVELDPTLEAYEGRYRRPYTGAKVRPWSRLLFDREREVFVALTHDGVHAARYRLERDDADTPVVVIQPMQWAPWSLYEIYRAIDAEARWRRLAYGSCARCDRPIPPEDRVETDQGSGGEEWCEDCRGRESS